MDKRNQRPKRDVRTYRQLELAVPEPHQNDCYESSFPSHCLSSSPDNVRAHSICNKRSFFVKTRSFARKLTQQWIDNRAILAIRKLFIYPTWPAMRERMVSLNICTSKVINYLDDVEYRDEAPVVARCVHEYLLRNGVRAFDFEPRSCPELNHVEVARNQVSSS